MKLFRLLCGILFCLSLSVQGKEIVNDITQLNPITVDKVVFPTTIEEISHLVAKHNGPISIGGGRYSQGGQTATDNCLFIDMRNLNRIIDLDIKNKLITIQTGITWRKIQEYIDQKHLSIMIMQSYSNFTVGGSLSVNVHGRYVGQGSIIRSVKSIKLVMADGKIKIASRNENPDLFYSAIGGYGGIGVIVEATLKLVNNNFVERNTQKMCVSKYKDFFLQNVRDSKSAIFHNADLYPPHYKSVNSITWVETTKPLTIKEKLSPQKSPTVIDQLLLKWIASGPGGTLFREYIYDQINYSRNKIVFRNYEASCDLSALEPASRKNSTYVLQEYFIPVNNFDVFVKKLSKILTKNKVNVLNVSVRHALPDNESMLSWSRNEVFSFVIYYKQGVRDENIKVVSMWTNQLIDAALSLGGAYYLPYQITANKEQFLKSYPNSHKFFALKAKVDPNYKFRNKLWDKYYSDP
jgi:FAD/FMN-containing dehydrogenase